MEKIRGHGIEIVWLATTLHQCSAVDGVHQKLKYDKTFCPLTPECDNIDFLSSCPKRWKNWSAVPLIWWALQAKQASKILYIAFFKTKLQYMS